MRSFTPPTTDAFRRHRPVAGCCRQRAAQSSPYHRRPRPRPAAAACAVKRELGFAAREIRLSKDVITLAIAGAGVAAALVAGGQLALP
jgi:hypothetical protein